MRFPSLIVMCFLGAALASPECAAAATAPVTAGGWLSQVQSAPAREVLAMMPQQDVPATLALSNGNTVVAGTVNGRLIVAELLPNGRPDPAFGQGGVAITSIRLLPWQLLSLPGGGIMVLGPSRSPGEQEPVITNFPDWQLLRLRSDGSPDPAFGHAGLLAASGIRVPGEGPASNLRPELTPSGGVLLPTIIGPVFSTTTVSALVRLNADGSRDPSFASGGTFQLPGYLAAFSVLADGSTVVAVQSRTSTALIRLTPAGVADPAFAGGTWVQTPVYSTDAMLVQPGGGILLHGYTATNLLGGSRIWRYTAAGTPDLSWGSEGASAAETGYGYVRALFASGDGTTLLVTGGFTVPSGVGPTSIRVTRFTASGQAEPSPGSPGLVAALPFGGGTYEPGRVVSLSQESFEPSGVIQRADGSLLLSGFVGAAESYPTEAGPEELAWTYGLGLDALNVSYSPDLSFNGAPRAKVSVRVASTCLNPRGIAVKLTSSRATWAVVTVSALGRTIAKGTVPFFGRGQAVSNPLARIPLNRAGQALRRRHLQHVKLSVSVTAASLAGSRASARASATVAG